MAFQSEQDVGATLHHWHSGQGDPIYQVGSMFYAGRNPTPESVEEAIGELERLRRQARGTREKRELTSLLRYLNSWIARRGLGENPKPKRPGTKDSMTRLREMVRREKPFDPEAKWPRATKPHHFAVNRSQPRIELYAAPYDRAKKGFYFHSLEEYRQKARISGAEEFAIDFIDGPDCQLELFKALEIDQSTLEFWFKELAKLNEETAAGLFGVASSGRLHPKTQEKIEEALEKVQEGDWAALPMTTEEFVDEMLEDGALDGQPLSQYFDYDSFGRDMRLEFDAEDLEAYDGMSDQEVGETYVDDIGGPAVLGAETLKVYFDAEAFGRDLEGNGEVVEFTFAGRTYLLRGE